MCVKFGECRWFYDLIVNEYQIIEYYIKHLQRDLDRAGATILVIMSEFRKSIKWFASYRASRRFKCQLAQADLIPMLDELRAQLVAIRKSVRKRKSSGADIGSQLTIVFCTLTYYV